MILLIDSYDSFSHNLRRLIEVNTGKEVVTIYNDTFAEEEYELCFKSWIKYFNYIIVGPGPGHPSNPQDIGIIGWLFRYFGEHPEECVPVLGVCFGFQSLCHEFGNDVLRLDSIKHGQVYDIQPVLCDLFGLEEADLSPFPSVRYHSLHVKLTAINDNIVPLATCEELESQPNKVLMAGRHAKLPLYGVQYHPESVCSEKGDQLIQRFDAIATKHNAIKRPNLSSQQETKMIKKNLEKYMRDRAVHENWLLENGTFENNDLPEIQIKKFEFAALGVKPIDVCEHFAKKERKFFFLNSAADPGDWSIIGLPIENESEIISHSVDSPTKVILQKFNEEDSKIEMDLLDSIWNFVASRMEKKFLSRASIEKKTGKVHSRPLPFYGGYLGFFSYEEGKHLDLTKLESFCVQDTPDTKLVFIERAILYDHRTNSWFMISIHNAPDESEYCDEIILDLVDAESINIDLETVPASVKWLCKEEDQGTIEFEFPDREVYQKQFNLCQKYLHAGDSYELCLTTQLKILLPSYLNTWEIYKVLALHKNPSPYSCFMHFDDCVLISSSPERFLSWKDSPEESSQKLVELRPIKGTVRNTDSITLEDATKILRTPKEMGENLMIVDLIRHDLHLFINDVQVNSLMSVEEYKTVYQLVSVIQGHLPEKGYHGIDVLQLSLPPGSMTGAPKKRSVELLQGIESMQSTMISGGRRGIYSGVAGYWSITDDSDWSVVIRSIMHYKEDSENTGTTSVWRIGAGGAITVLSEEEAEWEEMEIKLSSTLQIFS